MFKKSDGANNPDTVYSSSWSSEVQSWLQWGTSELYGFMSSAARVGKPCHSLFALMSASANDYTSCPSIKHTVPVEQRS